MSVAHETLPLSIRELQRTREPLERATALPQAAFTDPRVLDWELEHVFMGGWVCVGHVDQVARARRLPHGRDRRARASSSSPTTTASRTPSATPAATAARASSRSPRAALARVQCPYHAWSYGFDGSLRNAPHTDEIEDFDPRCYGLRAVRLAVVEGLVLIDLSGSAPRARRARRRPGARAGALPARRPAPRAADRLRRRRQLEGDRRELQRVPALPGRAPRAQPAQPLPLGRDAHAAPAPGAAAR